MSSLVLFDQQSNEIRLFFYYLERCWQLIVVDASCPTTPSVMISRESHKTRPSCLQGGPVDFFFQIGFELNNDFQRRLYNFFLLLTRVNNEYGWMTLEGSWVPNFLSATFYVTGIRRGCHGDAGPGKPFLLPSATPSRPYAI